VSARDRILARVRRATGQSPATDKPAPLRPAISEPADVIAQFIAQTEAASATVSRLASLDDLPGALAEELRNRNLPAAIRTGDDPAFARDWGGLEHTTGPGRIEEPATLTRAVLGVAETGSLVFASGPDNPVTLNFLGETHFAVVAAGDIKAGYEEVWAALGEQGTRSRTVNFVTGPSRSADIGQTLQLGAHGPVAVHVFIVDGAPG